MSQTNTWHHLAGTHTPNKDVLVRVVILRMVDLLSHVCRMEDGRIPKVILCVECASGARRVGRPGLLWCKACRPSRSALVQGVSAVQVCSGARRVGRPGLLWCKACRPSRSALMQGVSAVQVCSGARRVGRPGLLWCKACRPSRYALLFRDPCKREIKYVQINIFSGESVAADRINWRQTVKSGVRKAEEKRNELWTEKSVWEKSH